MIDGSRGAIYAVGVLRQRRNLRGRSLGRNPRKRRKRGGSAAHSLNGTGAGRGTAAPRHTGSGGVSMGRAYSAAQC